MIQVAELVRLYVFLLLNLTPGEAPYILNPDGTKNFPDNVIY